jgi:hypothetical protein
MRNKVNYYRQAGESTATMTAINNHEHDQRQHFFIWIFYSRLSSHPDEGTVQCAN